MEFFFYKASNFCLVEKEAKTKCLPFYAPFLIIWGLKWAEKWTRKVQCSTIPVFVLSKVLFTISSYYLACCSAIKVTKELWHSSELSNCALFREHLQIQHEMQSAGDGAEQQKKVDSEHCTFKLSLESGMVWLCVCLGLTDQGCWVFFPPIQ